jgi:hypothetical protein
MFFRKQWQGIAAQGPPEGVLQRCWNNVCRELDCKLMSRSPCVSVMQWIWLHAVDLSDFDWPVCWQVCSHTPIACILLVVLLVKHSLLL